MAHSSDSTDILSAARLFGEILDADNTGLIVQSGTANLMANATALSILGVNETRLLEMPPGAADWQARHTDGRPLVHGEFPGIQALRSRCPVNDRTFSLVEQTGGQRRWISASAVPCPGTLAGNPILYCFIRDVGKPALEPHAGDYIEDEFLAMLSHEMRTPLNGIMGMLQLSLHSRSRDSIQEYLAVALESSKHLLLLLGDLDEIAGGDANHPLQAKSQSFDLESAIAPAIASSAASARSKRLEVACRIDHRLPKRLWGDAGRIRRIIFNLLANAVKQTQRGEINVVVSPLAEHDPLKRHGLHILIQSVDAEKTETSPASPEQTAADAALGVAANIRLRFFIVKRLVKVLGGAITVACRQDARHEVRVSLPLQARQELGASAGVLEENAARQAGGARILVVEDEPLNLKTMLLYLQLLGCEAVGADSAYKGLAMLRKEKFDVVLMDIQMPGLDGLEATRLIRGDTSGAMDADIPIVAITAHAMHGDKERILKAGVDEYLAKPVYLEQVRAVLSKLLQRPLEMQNR